MIGWLLDTNVVAEIISSKGSQRVKAWSGRQGGSTRYLSILTLAEYDQGIANLPNADPRIPLVVNLRDSLAARFAGRILTVADVVVRRWGVIGGHARRETGHPPPIIDTLLAATAQEHGLYLATRNVRDVRYTKAMVFNPWTDDPAGFPLRLPR